MHKHILSPSFGYSNTWLTGYPVLTVADERVYNQEVNERRQNFTHYIIVKNGSYLYVDLEQMKDAALKALEN